MPVGSLPCGYLANLCPVWLPDGSLPRCISGVAAKTRGKVTFFFCIISPFREVFVPLLANCALIYLLHNSLKSKNIANFAPANALVAELVDAPDLGSGVSRRAGSSPVRRTNKNPNCLNMSSWGFCVLWQIDGAFLYWFMSVADILKIFMCVFYGYQCQSYSLDENDDHLVRASNVADIPPKQVLY